MMLHASHNILRNTGNGLEDLPRKLELDLLDRFLICLHLVGRELYGKVGMLYRLARIYLGLRCCSMVKGLVG